MPNEVLTRFAAFYAPLPKFGKKLSHQWGNFRQDFELTKPVVQGTIYDVDPNNIKAGVLAGFDFGEEDFTNKFRIIWQKNDQTFLFQCNSGTQNSPVWDTAFYVDCGDDNIVFLKESVFAKNNSFQTTFKETESGGASESSETLKVDSAYFYLSSSSGDGKPILSLHDSPGAGITNVVFKETESGGASFSDDSVSFDSEFFYLSSGGDEKPVVSLNELLDEKSITLRYPSRDSSSSFWVPAKDITIRKAYANLLAADSGFYPSVTWSVKYGTTRFSGGTELITDGVKTGFYPLASEHFIASFDNPDIPKDNIVWLDILDLGEGNNIEESFHLTLHFKENR